MTKHIWTAFVFAAMALAALPAQAQRRAAGGTARQGCGCSTSAPLPVIRPQPTPVYRPQPIQTYRPATVVNRTIIARQYYGGYNWGWNGVQWLLMDTQAMVAASVYGGLNAAYGYGQVGYGGSYPQQQVAMQGQYPPYYGAPAPLPHYVPPASMPNQYAQPPQQQYAQQGPPTPYQEPLPPQQVQQRQQPPPANPVRVSDPPPQPQAPRAPSRMEIEETCKKNGEMAVRNDIGAPVVAVSSKGGTFNFLADESKCVPYADGVSFRIQRANAFGTGHIDGQLRTENTDVCLQKDNHEVVHMRNTCQ